jgi:hypothetical protein
MSKRREVSRRRRKSNVVPAAAGPVSRQHNGGPPLLSDHQVLTFPQWCALCAISQRTGRRLIASGRVKVVQLSSQRIGISVAAHRAFLQASERVA